MPRKQKFAELIASISDSDGKLCLARASLKTRKSFRTVAFNTWVAVGRKRIGRVRSAGDGSPYVFEPPELEAYIATKCGEDPSFAVTRLLREYEDERDYARQVRRQRVVFVRDGVLRRTIRFESFDAFIARKAELEAELPGDVLNNMPWDDAVARYRALAPLPIPLPPPGVLGDPPFPIPARLPAVHADPSTQELPPCASQPTHDSSAGATKVPATPVGTQRGS